MQKKYPPLVEGLQRRPKRCHEHVVGLDEDVGRDVDPLGTVVAEAHDCDLENVVHKGQDLLCSLLTCLCRSRVLEAHAHLDARQVDCAHGKLVVKRATPLCAAKDPVDRATSEHDCKQGKGRVPLGLTNTAEQNVPQTGSYVIGPLRGGQLVLFILL